MKVIIKGGHIPTAYVGSQSYLFSKGSSGVLVKELSDLGDWRREGEKWGYISAENKDLILAAVRQWLVDRIDQTFEIDHSWRAVQDRLQAEQDNYAKSTLKLRAKIFNDCINEGGEGYNPYTC